MTQSSEGRNAATLAAEFEAKAREFAELVRGLDDEQWLEVTGAEGWSIGTTAHHVGQSIVPTWDFAQAMLANDVPIITQEDLNAFNAAHAAEFPNPDKAETLAMIEKSAVEVASSLAALDDAALDHSAVVTAFGPEPTPVRAWVEKVVIGHIGSHQASIEAAIGK